MLHHIVLMTPKDADGLAQIKSVMPRFAALCLSLDGVHGFQHGPNRDFEGKSPDYPYGFSVNFDDRAAHLRYEQHPEHQAAGGELVAASKGGHAGIFVVDLEV